ncbi:hypothetical protein JTB14_012043 [Gonioctena quinquepunctata]|nr:hypothetical protein JTB14_012043 [Gonioctena quinquepunctata]
MRRTDIFKNLEDAVEYLYSEQIEADLITLPSEVDELTDEELLDEENLGLPVYIAGLVEIQTQNLEKSNEGDNVPSAHLVLAPKKPKKETPEKLIENLLFMLVKKPAHNHNLSVLE